MPTYINRTLIADKGSKHERAVLEAGIASITAPLIILGEPGSGKTRLTESLQQVLGARRLSAGTFLRAANPAQFKPSNGGRLIIDGLDEFTSATGGSVVDEVLKKLSEIHHPNFVLSCRTADWRGAADRYRIASDYGVEPVTLHLEPLSRAEAKLLLNCIAPSLDTEACLNELHEKDLDDLWGNPLTLSLVAEIAGEGGGLPKGKADLFAKASELLVRELNPGHEDSQHAQLLPDTLVDAAGAAFALLLISNSTGLFLGTASKAPASYFLASELGGLCAQQQVQAALRTRLFRSDGEGLLVPVHRVLAEFLGAKWLAARLSSGASRRRVFQLLTFAGGVPSALRGLHAWLAYFHPAVAQHCIANDPYGVLRYGEPEGFSLPLARTLLNALGSLADEDPYFRTEDWGGSAAKGLARPALKEEIVRVIASPDRRFHLSSLLLKGLAGSRLTAEIMPQLQSIVLDPKAAFIERRNASEALLLSEARSGLPQLVAELARQGTEDSERLALEIITDAKGEGFSARQIAETYVVYEGITLTTSSDDEDGRRRSIGSAWVLASALPDDRAVELLEEIFSLVPPSLKGLGWETKYEFRSFLQKLMLKLIRSGRTATPGQWWSWLRIFDDERNFDPSDSIEIETHFRAETSLRREIQRRAMGDASLGDEPEVSAWMAIVHYLPRASRGLQLTPEDAEFFLKDLASRANPTAPEAELWQSLIQSQRQSDGYPTWLVELIQPVLATHTRYREKWDLLTAKPSRDWQKEHDARERARLRRQKAKFEKHRASYASDIAAMASGEQLGPLIQPAEAYLNYFNDLKRDATPVDRLTDWLGEDIAQAALSGFVAALSKLTIPAAREIVETHSRNRRFYCESVLKSGAAELLRRGEGLAHLPLPVRESILAAWWMSAEIDARQLGVDVGAALEASLFESPHAIQALLRVLVEPQLAANASHIHGLYRLSRDEALRSPAGAEVVGWLRAHPTLRAETQAELIDIAIDWAPIEDILALVEERLSSPSGDEELDRKWNAAAFLLNFEANCSRLADLAAGDRTFLWAISGILRPEEHKDRPRRKASAKQLRFIVEQFAEAWPPVETPRSAWGRRHPWNAADLIQGCISSLAADPSLEASLILDELVSLGLPHYDERLRHARARQRRERREKEYRPPTVTEVRAALGADLPTRVDDLKAYVLDRLEETAKYIRNGETNAWKAFWSGTSPLDENGCRDRLIDLLRSAFDDTIQLMTESRMPDEKRADAIAIAAAVGLPIEIKGQWNAEVWNASTSQLDELYARDYRADGRGIYLVFWHGNVPNKNLKPHPDGLPRPNTPTGLHKMLSERVPSEDRARIEVVVIDVSASKVKTKK